MIVAFMFSSNLRKENLSRKFVVRMAMFVKSIATDNVIIRTDDVMHTF